MRTWSPCDGRSTGDCEAEVGSAQLHSDSPDVPTMSWVRSLPPLTPREALKKSSIHTHLTLKDLFFDLNCPYCPTSRPLIPHKTQLGRDFIMDEDAQPPGGARAQGQQSSRGGTQRQEGPTLTDTTSNSLNRSPGRGSTRLCTSSLQLLRCSIHVRHVPSSPSAQTGPRGLAGAGAEPTSHLSALSPTWQGESPSAGNFSALSHSSQPAPRWAFSVLFPGAKEHLSFSSVRNGGICCQEVSATPPRSPAGSVTSASTVSAHPTEKWLTQVPTIPSTSQQRHIPEGKAPRSAGTLQASPRTQVKRSGMLLLYEY